MAEDEDSKKEYRQPKAMDSGLSVRELEIGSTSKAYEYIRRRKFDPNEFNELLKPYEQCVEYLISKGYEPKEAIRGVMKLIHTNYEEANTEHCLLMDSLKSGSTYCVTGVTLFHILSEKYDPYASRRKTGRLPRHMLVINSTPSGGVEYIDFGYSHSEQHYLRNYGSKPKVYPKVAAIASELRNAAICLADENRFKEAIYCYQTSNELNPRTDTEISPEKKDEAWTLEKINDQNSMLAKIPELAKPGKIKENSFRSMVYLVNVEP